MGIGIAKQALETAVEQNAVDVDEYYEKKPTPQVEEEGSIMVIQVDGKGVPMKGKQAEERSSRLGKGEKRTKKKEAVSTVIYTIAPYKRTPEEVVEALVPELAGQKGKKTKKKRPVPVGKEVRATMDGKDVAFAYLKRKVEQRESEHIKDRVALTDGAPPLQDKAIKGFPSYTLVLDIIHATEYLWDAANAVYGEKHPKRIGWVSNELLQILSGETEQVIETLEGLIQEGSLSKSRKKAVKTTIGYYKRNLPYMQYDQYLANGWPIGTGIVEGACGHLVKDRMERSGMRWTKQGAQSILDLRATRMNKDWDNYQDFYRRCEHHRLYGSKSDPPSITEWVVLSEVA